MLRFGTCLGGLALGLAMVGCAPDVLHRRPSRRIEVLNQQMQSHRDADPWLTAPFDASDDDEQTWQHVLTLRNLGNAALTVKSVCVVRAASATEAAARGVSCLQAGTVPFQVDDIEGSYEPEAETPFAVRYAPILGRMEGHFLRISSDADDEPFVAVELTVPQALLCAEPADRVVDFEVVTVGESASRPLSLTNCGALPLHITGMRWQANPDEVFAITQTAATELAVGASLALEATFAPQRAHDYRDASRGQVSFTVAEPFAAEISFTLLGSSVSAGPCQLEVSPQGLDLIGMLVGEPRYGIVSFGNVPLYHSKSLPITLRNVSSSLCTIERIEWDRGNTPDNEFGLRMEDGTEVPMGNTAAVSVLPGATALYMATFEPTRSSTSLSADYSPVKLDETLCAFTPQSCNGVKLVTNDTVTNASGNTDDPSYDGAFSIGFYAKPVEPCIDIFPPLVDFGVVTIDCDSRPRDVTLYNTCEDPVTVGLPFVEPAIQSPAHEFSMVSPPSRWPIDVRPGASVGAQVVFYPRRAGTHTGLLVLPVGLGQGSDAPDLTVGLMGEGSYADEQTDLFDQVSENLVDVLFVVDDSGSMMDEQETMAAVFPQFFHTSRVVTANYHIAVTTTLFRQEGLAFGTAPSEMAGHYTACPGNDRFLTPDSHDPEAQFACNVMTYDPDNVFPDREQSSEEGGLQAARSFLSPPLVDDPEANGGFLRDEAKLHVIIVSDEKDQSDGPVDLYVDFFQSLKGLHNRHLIKLSAIAKSAGETCSTDDSFEGDERYLQATVALNGSFQSICDDDWSTTMTRLGLESMELLRQFSLSRDPDPDQIEVCVVADPLRNSPCVPQTQGTPDSSAGCYYDSAQRTLVFHEASTPPRGSRIEVRYKTACFGGGY